MKISTCPATYKDTQGRSVVCMAWMDWRDDKEGTTTLKCRTCGYTIKLNPKKKGAI